VFPNNVVVVPQHRLIISLIAIVAIVALLFLGGQIAHGLATPR
jgi:hypothetical protein